MAALECRQQDRAVEVWKDNMSSQVRVLLVEDSPEDALLIARELQDGGINSVCERVATAVELEAALSAHPWDIVISDYSLPQLNGHEALKLCQDWELDLPFIVVSGRIGEALAVEMMKAGAHDYVMKNDLTRLPAAVRRELAAAGERRARRTAEAARTHLAAIVATCDDAIISKTLDGVIMSWNAGAERIFGYTAQEMIGQPVSTLLPPHRPDDLLDIYERLREGQSLVRQETVRMRKDGAAIDVSLTVSPIQDASGRVTGASMVLRDITERKRMEEERLALLQELTIALANVKSLGGLLPMCLSCKKIRNDDGYWEQVETYRQNHSNADFLRGLCPECAQRLESEQHRAVG